MRTAALLLILNLLPVSVAAVPPQTIGWVENVSILPQQFSMAAKIDTGADNSSVHAENITVFEKEDGNFVSFTLKNKQGESVRLETRLVRYTEIKSKLPGAEPIRRPVVELTLCIGETAFTAPVNLANRQHFRYRMLIGRSYLKRGFLVDSNRKYSSEPACNN